MKILLVGGTGFIATHFVLQNKSKYSITIISSHDHKFHAPFDDVDYIFSDWRTFEFDNYLSNNDFDWVIHFGWGSHPRISNIDIFKDFKTTLEPTVRLFYSVYKYSSASLIFLSSYGALPCIDSGYSDQNISSYASGKYSAECYLETMATQVDRVSYVFRISNPYGLYQDPFGTQGVLPIVLRKAIANDRFKFFDDAANKKDYVRVEDVGLALSAVVESSNLAPGFRKYDIGSGESYSVIDIIKIVDTVVSLRHIVDFEDLVFKDVSGARVNALDNSPFSLEYDWFPQTDMSREIGPLYSWVESLI